MSSDRMVPRPPEDYGPRALIDRAEILWVLGSFGMAILIAGLLFAIGIAAGLVVVGFRLVTGG